MRKPITRRWRTSLPASSKSPAVVPVVAHPRKGPLNIFLGCILLFKRTYCKSEAFLCWRLLRFSIYDQDWGPAPGCAQFLFLETGVLDNDTNLIPSF